MPKRKTSFNPKWSIEDSFISKSAKDDHHAYCTLCRCDVDISCQGKGAIDRHVSTEKHKRSRRAAAVDVRESTKRSQSIESFIMVKKEETADNSDEGTLDELEGPSTSTQHSADPHQQEPHCSDSDATEEAACFSESKPSHQLDISWGPADGPTQPVLKVYPRTVQGDRKRAFNSLWFTQFPWLEYSQSGDSAYCFACRHFSLPNTAETPFTAHAGYTNWKKAMYNDGGFKRHEKSEGHFSAMFAWSDYKNNGMDSFKIVAVDPAYIKKVEENWTYIKTVAEVLRLTPMQNIAQREHMESEDKENLIEMAEILECLSDMVRESIIQEVKESKVFSLVADETKDFEKTEQLSLVLRYYYNGAVHESFLDFLTARELNAAGLSQTITQCLQKYGLDYKSNLVGQGYDGASVMSGRCTEVADRIGAEAKHAFYVHCNAHCLNLVIVDSVKAVPEVDCFFALLQKLYVYMSGSYVHERWLSVQRHMYEDAPRELPRLSDTRWACQYQACKSLMDRLPAVLLVLREIDVGNSGERSVEARGLLVQIDLTFIGALAVFKKILGDAKCVSDMLQSPSPDLARAVDLIIALQETLEDCRAGTCFDDLWQQTVATAEQCNVAVEKRQSETSRLGLLESTIGQRRCKEGDKDRFRFGVFYPSLEHLSAELQRRFSKNNCDIMRGIQALNPKGGSFLEEEPVLHLGSLYDCDVEDLKHELCQARKVIQRKVQSGIQLSNLLDFAAYLEPYKEAFHQLFRLCQIAVASPASSAICERSSSALIKHHLRTTTTDDRLSNIAVLNIERRRARLLNLDTFVERFAQRHQNRRIKLS